MPMRSTGNNLIKVRARALTALMPPLRLRLSEWIEKNIRLPESVTATQVLGNPRRHEPRTPLARPG